MKAKVEGKAFAEAAALADSVADAKAAQEILGFLHMEFKDGFGSEIIIRATDGEQRVRISVPAEVSEPGIVLIQATRLSALAQRLAGGPVAFSGNAEALTMRGSGSSFKLQGASPTEYPSESAFESDMTYQVKAGPFAAALKGAESAVAPQQDTRHTLKGIQVLFGGPAIRFVATDGNRITTLSLPVGEGFPETEVVIPPTLFKPLQVVLRDKETVNICIGKSEVGVDTPLVQLYGRLLAGKYVAALPHVDRVLAYTKKVSVPVGELAEALERVRIATDNLPAHPAILVFSADGMLVTDEAGDAETVIEGVKWEGEPFRIMLKSDYALDFLGLLPKPDAVVLTLDTPLTTMGMTTERNSPAGVIMPLRPTKTVDPATPAAAPAS